MLKPFLSGFAGRQLDAAPDSPLLPKPMPASAGELPAFLREALERDDAPPPPSVAE